MTLTTRIMLRLQELATAHSGRGLFVMLGVQTVVAVTVAFLLAFNLYSTFTSASTISICLLYATGDKFDNMLEFFSHDSGCRTSINASMVVLGFTVALVCLKFYVEKSGRLADNIYVNVMRRWYMAFAAIGSVIAITVAVVAINTTAGVMATCGAADQWRATFNPRAPSGSVTCSMVLNSDGSSRYQRLWLAIGLSWASLVGWIGYIALYVSAARQY
ncbi:hypothetical protein BC828DRAFT_373400 [Blastocladiella britannica]|nr:hypothetical protein BC828DRAFT_373400 [Blastocladiella britannica]